MATSASKPVVRDQPSVLRGIGFILVKKFHNIGDLDCLDLDDENRMVRRCLWEVLKLWGRLYMMDLRKLSGRLDAEIGLIELKEHQRLIETICSTMEEMIEDAERHVARGADYDPSVICRAKELESFVNLILVRFKQGELVNKAIASRVDKMRDYCFRLLSKKSVIADQSHLRL